jgi:hypothetical protein
MRINQDLPTQDGRANIRPYNLRDRLGDQDSFKVAMDAPHSSKSYYPPSVLNFVFRYVMTQMSARVGIKKHRRATEAALIA